MIDTRKTMYTGQKLQMRIYGEQTYKHKTMFKQLIQRRY